MKYVIAGYAVSSDRKTARLLVHSTDNRYWFTVDVTEKDGVSISDTVSIVDKAKFESAMKTKIASQVVVGQEIEI